ncbi:MAG: AI-2E family transporter [Rhodospirillales bacterium]
MTREVRIIAWIAIFAGIGWLVNLLSPILLPFVAGLAVAYFLEPLVGRLSAHKCPRPLASGLIVIGFYAAVAAGLAALVPLLEIQFQKLAERLPAALALAEARFGPWLADLKTMLGEQDMSDLRDAAGGYAGAVFTAVQNLLGGVWRGGMAVFEILSLIIITPLVAFYMIMQWPKITESVDSLLPVDHAGTIRTQLRAIDDTIAGFVRGQACVCLVLGIWYAAALSILGLDAGLIVGALTGLISFVPYVGAGIGMLTGLALAWAQFGGDFTMIALVAGVFITGQTAESYFLTPRLIGGRIGLHDLWIIFALMAGGALYGFLGVLLAVPSAAVIGVLVRFSIARYRESALYLGVQDSPKRE